MKLVLVHIGDKFPSHMWDTIKQIRRNTKIIIYVLCSKELSKTNSFNEYCVEKIDYTPFLNDPINIRFLSLNFMDKYGHNGFWSHSMQRLLLIESFMRLYELESIVHIENDISLYHDPLSFKKLFKEKFHCLVACTPLGPELITAAYTYIDNLSALEVLNKEMLNYLALGETFLLKEIPGVGCVNEMVLLRYVQKNNANIIKNLPILPTSENFEYFGSIFDGASWGQYIGGTPDVSGGSPPGCFFLHHWVGIDLSKGLYEVVWSIENGLNAPYVLIKRTGERIKLNCLHVHCKDFSKFV